MEKAEVIQTFYLSTCENITFSDISFVKISFFNMHIYFINILLYFTIICILNNTYNATHKWLDFCMNMWCKTTYLRYIAQLVTKNLWCTVSKNSRLLVYKRTLRSTKLKKNSSKTFYRLNCKEFRKKSQKSIHLLRCTKCMSHVRYWYITIHVFFNHPTSIKWFISWIVGTRL